MKKLYCFAFKFLSIYEGGMPTHPVAHDCNIDSPLKKAALDLQYRVPLITSLDSMLYIDLQLLANVDHSGGEPSLQ